MDRLRFHERFLSWIADQVITVASSAMTWSRFSKRLFVQAGDSILVLIATWLAFSLRLGVFAKIEEPVIIFAAAMGFCWFVAAAIQKTYQTFFRYTGRGAVVSLAGTIVVAAVPLIIGFMVIGAKGVPRTIALLGPMIFFLAMTIARIIGRYILVDLIHSRPIDGQLRRVIIYGAGAVGQRLGQSLAGEAGMQLVGYVDDDNSKAGQRLDGVRVHMTDEIGHLVESLRASDVILAIPSAPFSRQRQIIKELEPLEVNVKTLPPVNAILDGRISIDALRPVQVEDLLGRVPVEPIEDLLDQPCRGKVVLVTGAGGSIGSEICRQIAKRAPKCLLLVDNNEFALFSIEQELLQLEASPPSLRSRLINVADRDAVDRLFAEFSPDTVFHAAAYKHVPLVEENVVSAVANNVFSTRYLVDRSVEAGVQRFILVSSDKAVRPPNVMGATKRVCEMILQDQAVRDQRTIYSMVRFGNVLGSSGSVVPAFHRQIAAGGPVTVTHRDVTRFFMTIPEAAQLVIQAGGMAEGGEVYVLDMGEPVRIMQLARTMIQLAGLTVRNDSYNKGDIEIVETGLRPGEKMYEELLLDESAVRTRHPSIMRADEDFPSTGELSRIIELLAEAVANNDAIAARRLLRELVPTLRAA